MSPIHNIELDLAITYGKKMQKNEEGKLERKYIKGNRKKSKGKEERMNGNTKGVFGSALDRIDFDRIDFVRIDFERINLCLDTIT